MHIQQLAFLPQLKWRVRVEIHFSYKTDFYILIVLVYEIKVNYIIKFDNMCDTAF